jgi:uncharacterized phage-associated protein
MNSLKEEQVPTDIYAIVNWFLDRSKSENEPLVLARLQAYVYFAYGWYYAKYNESLFNSVILATRRGPIIAELTAAFKDCGQGFIDHRIRIFRNGRIEILKNSIYLSEYELNSLTKEERIKRKETENNIEEILMMVWDSYSKLSYAELFTAAYRLIALLGISYDDPYLMFPNKVISPAVICNFFRKLKSLD